MNKDKQEFIAQQEMRLAIEKTFQTLLAKNQDSEAGFKKLVGLADDRNISKVFSNLAIMHSNFCNELTEGLREINRDADETGTIAAKAHRLWIDLKEKVSGHDDLQLINSALTGNTAAIEEYERILKEQVLPKATADVLVRHLDQIKKAENDLKILEKTEKEERARKNK